jgi:D-alanyl-D-alanine carboxypeptidase/D-alanyl-D-alanine-endopeptidase (penicillin-binding protein 4)
LASLVGVNLPSPQIKKLESNGKNLGTHKSLPLVELSALGMEYSNNIMVEAPFYMAKKKGKIDLLSWLKKSYPQVPWKQTSLENASGLTHKNLSTSKELSHFLRALFTIEFQGRAFPSLLTISGHSGNLRKRLKTPELAYKVWGKTGSLHYVDNVAGYLFSNSGKKLAFAILMNDKEALKTLREENLSKASQKLRMKSKAWSQKAKQRQNELLKKWITTY